VRWRWRGGPRGGRAAEVRGGGAEGGGSARGGAAGGRGRGRGSAAAQLCGVAGASLRHALTASPSILPLSTLTSIGFHWINLA